MIRLDGKVVSEKRRAKLRDKIAALSPRLGRAPHLAVVLVGEITASVVYVRNKEKACENVGLKSTKVNLPVTVTQEALNATIDRLNQDPEIDGILVQLPLPGHLSVEQVLLRIHPSKDADGLTYMSMGLLAAGKAVVKPCTPQGVINILSHYEIPLKGKHAVVVGRSNIVGKPMAQLLLSADATVTVCHSATPRLAEWTSIADIVVVAAGKKGVLGRNDFKKNSVIVDVGIHGTGSGATGISGDVRWEGLEDWVYAATPVPGGVGPMTITTLLENTVILAEQRLT